MFAARIKITALFRQIVSASTLVVAAYLYLDQPPLNPFDLDFGSPAEHPKSKMDVAYQELRDAMLTEVPLTEPVGFIATSGEGNFLLWYYESQYFLAPYVLVADLIAAKVAGATGAEPERFFWKHGVRVRSPRFVVARLTQKRRAIIAKNNFSLVKKFGGDLYLLRRK